LDAIAEIIERTRKAKEAWREQERKRPFEEKLRVLQEFMAASYSKKPDAGLGGKKAVLKGRAPR
jgi:hypothetical protein